MTPGPSGVQIALMVDCDATGCDTRHRTHGRILADNGATAAAGHTLTPVRRTVSAWEPLVGDLHRRCPRCGWCQRPISRWCAAVGHDVVCPLNHPGTGQPEIDLAVNLDDPAFHARYIVAAESVANATNN